MRYARKDENLKNGLGIADVVAAELEPSRLDLIHLE
jgi:hypothetical protein